MSDFNVQRGEFVPRNDLGAYEAACSAVAERAWELGEEAGPLSYVEAKEHRAFKREKELQAKIASGVPEWRAIL